MSNLKSKVILAGAGPGDPDLISVKALNAVRNADVILYDSLVNKALLTNASSHCKLVYVGKRKGKKEFSQEEINDLILFYACRSKNVLRLKGGDPFVFGRGHEELEYIRRTGIHVEVIPGISSAIAAPSSVGIPLTKRGVNESFWVITGMLSSGNFSSDLVLASRSSATVVILMGMTRLSDIMNLIAETRSSEEPVAIIQNACCRDQRAVVGTASTITALAERQGITSPAVIVVGSVVLEGNLSEILPEKDILMKVAV